MKDSRCLFVACLIAGSNAAVACGPFFYQAPPTLDAYPERFGTRTWREIFPEKYPAPSGALDNFALASQCQELVSAFTDSPEFIARVEKLATSNRDGDYRVRYANLLNEMQELATAKADEAGTRAYLEWRLQHLDENDGFIRFRPQPWDGRYFSDDERAQAVKDWEQLTLERLADIDKMAAAAPAFLQPYWQIQRAAWLFRRGEFAEAAAGFDSVMATDPHTARAEVAQLMSARCSLEQARLIRREAQWKHDTALEQSAWGEAQKANDQLASYERNYPNGRFLAEAIGWEGALASDAGSYGEAVSAYLREMDTKPTREVIRSVLRECDRCFAKALETNETGNLPVGDIARHPAVAMSLIYQCLDPASRIDVSSYPYGEDYSGGRDWIQSANDRVVTPRRNASEMLVRLGAAIGQNRSSFSAPEWKADYLAALAWIALENGEAAQALRLTEEGKDVSDPAGDLLMVRGLALERTGRLADAAACYGELRKKAPDGPLAVDLGYRIASCQRRIAAEGFAAAELAGAWAVPREPGTESPSPDFPALRLDGETAQWIDTLLQFAPLDSLEAIAGRPGLNPEFASRVRAMIRCRAMAREDFTRAEKWLETGENPISNEYESEGYFSLSNWAWMDRTRWKDSVEPILKAKAEFRAAKAPDAQAQALLKIGASWQSARGKVTSPSLDPRDIFNSEPEIADSQRRKNARMLGLDEGTATQELDRRDEDWHALQVYLAAANLAESKEVRASALSAANRCLLAMAQLTPYQADRAFELNRSALSRDIYRRLQTQCAGTPEASAAIYYSFPSASERGSWMPGDFVDWHATDVVTEAMMNQTREDDWQSQDMAENFRRRLGVFGAHAGEFTVEQLREQLAAIRRDFEPQYDSAVQSDVVNNLDDLDLFLKVPGVTPQMCATYFPMRLTDTADPTDNPVLEPAKDFVAFLRTIAPPQETATGPSQPPPYTVESWREFLRLYPKSPKAEAAQLRIARAIYRTYRTKVGADVYYWPQAPIWGGYKRMTVERDKPFDPAPIFAALDDYDKAYPNGRYASEIKLMRGGASIDKGDYPTALACLVSVLDDPTKRDLHYDAALELADCFSHLADDGHRAAILEAIKSNPRATIYLHRFVDGETCGSILRPLMPFFREVIGEPVWDDHLARN